MSRTYRELELRMKLIEKRYNTLLKKETDRMELLEKTEFIVREDAILNDIREQINKIEEQLLKEVKLQKLDDVSKMNTLFFVLELIMFGNMQFQLSMVLFGHTTIEA